MIKSTFKIIALGLSVLLIAGASQAQTIADALQHCGQVQNSLERLVCYDKIVNDMNLTSDAEKLQSVPAPIAKPIVDTSIVKQEISKENNDEPTVISETPAAVLPSNPADPDDNETYFGIEQTRLKELKTEDIIYATVVKIERSPRRLRLITLSNGQTWLEIEKVFLKVKVDESIYIERGVMGSFHLSKDNVNQRIQVKRVK